MLVVFIDHGHTSLSAPSNHFVCRGYEHSQWVGQRDAGVVQLLSRSLFCSGSFYIVSALPRALSQNHSSSFDYSDLGCWSVLSTENVKQ